MDFSPDTIIAPASAPGRSAVALLRLSGPRSYQFLQSIFHPARETNSWPAWRLKTGAFVDPADGQEIDRGMAVWMAAPHSYTGEQAAEISCHGSPLIIERLLSAFLALGARLADPGEFTRRAFLNGKMDLAEAEAVCDVVAAETQAALEVARRQLAGQWSRALEEVRDSLLDVAAEIEARIDFPEEDVPEADVERLAKAVWQAADSLRRWLAQAQRGRRLREGARVAIVGRANVGKSSLFNALVGSERAITTPHPGTTRDTIEARLDVKGVPVNLIDTAGIREASDAIERAGVERSISQIESADAVILVLDTSQTLAEEDHAVGRRLARRPVIAALNKADLPPAWSQEQFAAFQDDAHVSPQSTIVCSAASTLGIEDLEHALLRALAGDQDSGASRDVLVSNARHVQALGEALHALSGARDMLESGESLEFAATDLRAAINALGGILGQEAGEEILDRVFRQFCLGK